MAPKSSVNPARRCATGSQSMAATPKATPAKAAKPSVMSPKVTPANSNVNPARRCASRSQSMSATPKVVQPKADKPSAVLPKATQTKSNVDPARRCVYRSKSMSTPPKDVQPKTVQPKSIVKGAHRCNNRSKSVSFDLPPSFVAVASADTLKDDTPVDLTFRSGQVKCTKSMSNQHSVAQHSHGSGVSTIAQRHREWHASGNKKILSSLWGLMKYGWLFLKFAPSSLAAAIFVARSSYDNPTTLAPVFPTSNMTCCNNEAFSAALTPAVKK